ncbi:cancer/testis antigen 1-like [Cervus elaphus]|uniref:cancer/testis antigen 1-like n=1 Tax=Cervus canadensis TaxID=1574408 RepID=UPI001CA3328A|nr:cancer/testis antigen 1-like [Cervus canadensis]XP_043753021.1 cancer/testis antigen 1-like [Cervus elaphus]XP_043753044.1 cancer/testis antigen 1-like [Cervus elaphus]
MEPEAHGGGNMRAANEDAGAVAFAADTARGSHSVPGGAGGQDDPGDPAGPGDAIIHEIPGGVADLNNPRGPGAAGESDGTVGVIPQFPGAPQVPGPGGDAAPGAGILSNRPLQFSLTVPFSSHEEADNARHFLTRRTQLQGPIRKEIGVNGRMLVLRLTAEDHALLRRSIAFCLDQLSLVIWSLQHFVPPVSAKPQQGRGG